MKRLTYNRNKFQLPPGSRWRSMRFWDPVLGCSPCSLGCRICSSARRLSQKDPNHPLLVQTNDVYRFNGKIEVREEVLDEVKTFKDKEQVFACGRSDLFHENIPDNFIEKIIATIATRPDCTFLAITKRPERMSKLLGGKGVPKNLWLSVSVERQNYAEERLPFFKNINATRIVSAKPLLGPLNLIPFMGDIDMVIVGGEYAMPMYPDWVDNILAQCAYWHKPFSFHNWGLWVPGPGRLEKWVDPNGKLHDSKIYPDACLVHRHENDSSGYLLHDKIWDEYPCEKGDL